ncbi:MAG: DUF927 domain-containing protein [Alphaproteobacteria bacterium]|nr:MAG: DUF927 domain-containing protein [Alphaproteobacteria bacterium]
MPDKDHKHRSGDADITRKRKPSTKIATEQRPNLKKPLHARSHLPSKPADCELPHRITAVQQAIDSQGVKRDLLVVHALDEQGAATHYLLAQTALFLGQFAELSRLVFAAQLLAYQSPKGLRELAQLLLQTINGSAYVAEHDGYHLLTIDGSRYEMLVWRAKVHALGGDAPVPVVVSSDVTELPRASCAVDDWNSQVGRYCVSNPYMLVALCAAIAALLVRPYGLARVVLALVGGSSQGKTTVLRTIVSLTESAVEVPSFTGTENGIRAGLQVVQDRPACRDEMRQTEDFSSIVRMIFDLGNGAARETSTAQQAVRRAPALQCSLFVSNEDPLIELLAKKRVHLNEGIAARYFELHADAPMGMFHKIPPGMDAKAFADHLAQACTTHYGPFWDSLVKGVAKNHSKIGPWIAKKLPEIERELCEDLDIRDPVTRRLAKGIAGWACAGLLGVKLKLLPTKNEAVIAAMKLALRAHVMRQKLATTPIGEQVIRTVRDVIDRHSGKFPAFSTIATSEQVGIYGYRKTTREKTLFLFLPTVFEELVGQKFGLDASVRHLRQAGFLDTDSEGDQRQFRLPNTGDLRGLRKRFYAVKDTIRFEQDTTD